MFQKQARGFTLIELLIVIAILAILATVVLIVINPVQMFAQARDSQRIYDVNTLSNAVALYLTTVNNPALEGGGCTCAAKCWSSISVANCTFATMINVCGLSYTAAVDGTGWIPVDLADISGGSPISALPKDPSNTSTTYFYEYACDNNNKWFEFGAKMESCRYSHANSGCGGAGGDDVESTDGGVQNNLYEVGNKPGLNL